MYDKAKGLCARAPQPPALSPGVSPRAGAGAGAGGGAGGAAAPTPASLATTAAAGVGPSPGPPAGEEAAAAAAGGAGAGAEAGSSTKPGGAVGGAAGAAPPAAPADEISTNTTSNAAAAAASVSATSASSASASVCVWDERLARYAAIRARGGVAPHPKLVMAGAPGFERELETARGLCDAYNREIMRCVCLCVCLCFGQGWVGWVRAFCREVRERWMSGGKEGWGGYAAVHAACQAWFGFKSCPHNPHAFHAATACPTSPEPQLSSPEPSTPSPLHPAPDCAPNLGLPARRSCSAGGCRNRRGGTAGSGRG